jgi:hypothetical protein
LEKVCGMSERERAERGAQSRSLVAKRYSWSVVGPRWLELYDKVAEKRRATSR